MSSRLARRIREAERRLQVGTVTVALNDGRAVHIRKSDGLDILLASFRRISARIEAEPAPRGRFDSELDLLTDGIAESTADPLLGLTVETLQPIE